jgi:hypothetical protein
VEELLSLVEKGSPNTRKFFELTENDFEILKENEKNIPENVVTTLEEHLLSERFYDLDS